MYWLFVALSLILEVAGWFGVYDATVHGNPGTNTMSFAGALGGLATMIAGCGLGIVARIIQAAQQEARRLDEWRLAKSNEAALETSVR